MRKMKKGALLAALAGTTLFQFGGCLGGGQLWKTVWQGAGLATGGHLVDSFLWDNVLLGQDVNNAAAFGASLTATCAALPAADQAACLAGQRP